MSTPAPICGHPNWVSSRGYSCQRRTRQVCSACGLPTCSTHTRFSAWTDGRVCERWACREARRLEYESKS